MTSSAAVHEFFATSLAAYALFDGPGERSPNIRVRALSGQSRLLARFVERDRTGKFREAVTRLGLTASQPHSPHCWRWPAASSGRECSPCSPPVSRHSCRPCAKPGPTTARTVIPR